RLKSLALRIRDVAQERSQRRCRRRNDRFLFREQPCSIDAGQKTRCGRLDISFHADHLSGEEKRRSPAPLQGRPEMERRVDKSISMQTSETNQLRFFKFRNHPEDSPLYRVGHLGLETNQVVKSLFSILLRSEERRVGKDGSSRG